MYHRFIGQKQNIGQCPSCREPIVLNFFFQGIKNGDYRGVASFIELGINVYATKTWHKTALMVASEQGHLDIVRLLIKHGANVNAHLFSTTPLLLAAKNGHTDIVGLLIENAANLEAYDFFGNTALMWAVAGNHVETAELLIERGAKKDASYKFGTSALNYALIKGNRELIELLRNN